MPGRKAESSSAERGKSQHGQARKSSLQGPSRGAPASVKPKTSGASLHAPTQARMSERFGHDFSQVRVHTDSQSSSLASDLNANAYTIGEDIIFAEGEYQPGTTTGDTLIAHELTHVAQQALADGNGDGISNKDQPSEREAERAASNAIAGGAIDVQTPTDAAVSRDGDDNKDGGGFWNSVWNGMNDEGLKAQADKNKAWTDLKGGHVLDAGGDMMNMLISDPVNMLKSGLNTGVDMTEKGQADADKKLEDQTKDIPVLGSLVKGLDWGSEKMTEGVGGVLKGVGDIGGGLINGIAHPIDTAEGMSGIMEHASTIPGLGTVLKAGHGIRDLASDSIYGNPTNEKHEYGNTWGELAGHLFNPLTQMKDDQDYAAKMGQGIVDPEHKGLQGLKDKPVETITRALTNIAPMLMGAGEADATEASEAANAAKPTVPAAPVDPALAPTQPMPAVPPPGEVPVPPTQPMPTAPTVPGAPIDPALAPTQPVPTTPAPVDPMAPTQPTPQVSPAGPTPAPVDPVAPTQPNPTVPAEPTSPTPRPKNPVQQMPAVDPADVGRVQPPPGVKNPVVQMPAINPADMVPGAKPPPGWGTSAVDAPLKPPPPGWYEGPIQPAPPAPAIPDPVPPSAGPSTTPGLGPPGPPVPDPVPSTQVPSTQIPPSGPPTQPGMISPMADSVPAPAPPGSVPPSSGPPTQPGMISPAADSVPTPTKQSPVFQPAPVDAPPSTQMPSTQMPSTQMPSTQMPSTQVPSTTPMTAPGIGPPPDTIPGVAPPPNTVPGVGPPGPPLPGEQIPPTKPGMISPMADSVPPAPATTPMPNQVPPTQPSPGVKPAPVDAPPSTSQTPTPAPADSPPSTIKDSPTQRGLGGDEPNPVTKRSPGNPAPAPSDAPPSASQATTPAAPDSTPPSSQPPDTTPSSGPATERTPGPNAPDPGSPQADWEKQQQANIQKIQINDPDVVSTKPEGPKPAPSDAPPSASQSVTPASPDSTPPSSGPSPGDAAGPKTVIPQGQSGPQYGVPNSAWEEQAIDWGNQQTGPDADYIKKWLKMQ